MKYKMYKGVLGAKDVVEGLFDEAYVQEHEKEFHIAFESNYLTYRFYFQDEVDETNELVFNPSQLLALTRFIVAKVGVLEGKLDIEALKSMYRDYFSIRPDGLMAFLYLQGHEDTLPVVGFDINVPKEDIRVRAAGDGICFEADVFSWLFIPEEVVEAVNGYHQYCIRVLQEITKKALFNSVVSLRLEFSVSVLAVGGYRKDDGEIVFSVPWFMNCTNEDEYKDMIVKMFDNLLNIPEFIVQVGDYNLHRVIDKFIEVVGA